MCSDWSLCEQPWLTSPQQSTESSQPLPSSYPLHWSHCPGGRTATWTPNIVFISIRRCREMWLTIWLKSWFLYSIDGPLVWKMTVRKVETTRERSILLLPSQACLMSLYVVYCVPLGTMSYFNLQSPPELLCHMEQTFINIGFIFPF